MNWNLILFLLLLFLFIFEVKQKNNFVSPSFLFLLGFLISSFMLLLNTKNWNYVISLKTVCLIVFGFLCFKCGSLIVNLCAVNTNDFFGSSNNRFRYHLLSIGKIGYFILLIIIFLSVCFRIIDIISVTGSFDIFHVISIYKSGLNSSKLSLIIKLFNPIVIAIGIISVILIIQDILFLKRFILKDVLFLLGYFFYFSLTGARIEILYYFVYFLVAFLLIYKSCYKFSMKIIFIFIITGALIIFMFLWLGTFTGKTQIQTDLFDNISMYSSSNIAALDYKLGDFQYDYSNLGSYSIRGLSNIFSLFGVDLSLVEERNMEFIILGNMTHQTNIYTCFYPLLYEFGYFGTFVILFIEGIIFQFVFRKVVFNSSKNNHKWFCIYIYICGYFFFSFVAERVFSSLLTFTSLSLFLLIIVMFNKFGYKSLNRENYGKISLHH